VDGILQIWRIWLSGGWVMLPLFALALLLYAQSFQLVMYLRRTDIGSDAEMHWWEWVRSPGQAQGRVAEIIRYTQSDTSSAKQVRNRFEEIRLALVGLIDRRARFVGTLVSAAPLLGLLGTVLGMLQTFLAISTGGGAETADVVAGGIAEALVTTEAGLMVALPGLFVVMIIHRQRHRLEAQLARLESLTLTALRLD
jgi:biopolymer transport protein ExbB